MEQHLHTYLERRKHRKPGSAGETLDLVVGGGEGGTLKMTGPHKEGHDEYVEL